MEVVQKVVQECASCAVVEQPPKLIGRTLGCLLSARPVKAGTGQPPPVASQPPPRPAPPVQPPPAEA
jgi:hypothetical protein